MAANELSSHQDCVRICNCACCAKDVEDHVELTWPVCSQHMLVGAWQLKKGRRGQSGPRDITT